MIKRFIDFTIALVLLFILSPLLLIIALIIRLKLGSPVIFSQERPGLNGRIFKMYKFRTMKNSFDKNGDPLPDEQRMTRIGSILRSTSLDELPELINVLLGQMSLVGPRPLLVEYLPLYNQEQARRHEMRPGITGWAQINGRNSLSWEEKFQFDVWYVDNHSLWLDLKIVILTFKKVLWRDGITAVGTVSAEKFKGSSK